MSGLAHERTGAGPPLLLLHGTNSSREIWRPLVAPLSAAREVIAVDLPAHGASPPSSFTPPEWSLAVAALLDELGLSSVAVVGHSSGGWTALELAALGRASAVLALAPAGLWRDRSPFATDALLAVNWRLGQILGERSALALRSRLVRRLALRQVCARPELVPADTAIAMAETVRGSRHFPEHFRQTRRLGFQRGGDIDPAVAVHVVWGAQDRIARRGSRRRERLPAHARVETWSPCGHMIMWDAPERLLDAALALGAGAR